MRRARFAQLSHAALVLAALLAMSCAGSAAPAPPKGAAGVVSASTPRAAVLVSADYRSPTNRIDSTGAYLPDNGKPALVFVDAIWCFFCALARPAVANLRYEHQDRINFVILDFDLEADLALAQRLGIAAHPGYALVLPGQFEPSTRWFGPTPEEGLRDRIGELLAAPALASH